MRRGKPDARGVPLAARRPHRHRTRRAVRRCTHLRRQPTGRGPRRVDHHRRTPPGPPRGAERSASGRRQGRDQRDARGLERQPARHARHRCPAGTRHPAAFRTRPPLRHRDVPGAPGRRRLLRAARRGTSGRGRGSLRRLLRTDRHTHHPLRVPPHGPPDTASPPTTRNTTYGASSRPSAAPWATRPAPCDNSPPTTKPPRATTNASGPHGSTTPTPPPSTARWTTSSPTCGPGRTPAQDPRQSKRQHAQPIGTGRTSTRAERSRPYRGPGTLTASQAVPVTVHRNDRPHEEHRSPLLRAP